MKKHINIIKTLGVVVVSMCCFACSQDDVVQNDVQWGNVLRFELSDAAMTRAATDVTTKTTSFELADKAGLYVVKNGQVLQENVVLTYNASGFWEAAEAIKATDELKDAQFYAYYPYSATAVFDASSSTPFAAMVAASVSPAKQNSKSDYENADLMVSTAATVGQYNAVRLSLQHQKSLVCVELPNSSYIFDNDGMLPYVLAKSENAKFMLGETAVSPFFDETSQSYRLIVEPGENRDLTITFTNNGVYRTFVATGLSEIGIGSYAEFVIDGGASLVNMSLETGDYYCADGRLVKKDAETLPDNIIGVVFKIGTTDALCAANPQWCHGVVVGLSDVKAKWGNDKSTTSEQNAAGWRYWYRDFNLADQNGQTNAAKLDESSMVEEGYEVTMAWRLVPEPLEIGGFTLDYTSLMNEAVDNWNASHPLPSGVNSGWYIPSLGDWQHIEASRTLIESQLEKVGGDLFATGNYWSCNVRAAGSNWCYLLGKTAQTDRYKGVACNGNASYRFLLAF